ncbi:MAG: regulatory iron-sulfur-containing complex subunit RicT [Bacteroidota bacterium]
MGCTSCSSGTPGGCGNKGTCSSGGCSKLEVYDWLSNLQLPDGQSKYDLVEVRFKNSRKAFFRNTKNLSLHMGDVVVVDLSPGYDVGVVSVTGELARIQVGKKIPTTKPSELNKITKIAAQEEIDKWIKARSLEKEVMYKSRTLAVNLGLQMKISDVEFQADLTKATFYYTAEERVDFRQLIKDLADEFKIRIEMRQIGSRQEAARLGAIGSCGRELCCTTWLTDFRSVSTSAARYQQLSLNPQKLAGQCGKLKCCLNYELDMYLDNLKKFPKTETRLHTEKGSAHHIKTDVFKELMWYVYEGEAAIGSGMIALSPERVREIIRMNQESKKPKELIEFKHEVTVKMPDYENVVGQDSLNRFESSFKKNNKNRGRGGNNDNRPHNAGSNQNPNAQKNQPVKAQAALENPDGTPIAPKKKRPNNRWKKNKGNNNSPQNDQA